jgi:hypothetical protein
MNEVKNQDKVVNSSVSQGNDIPAQIKKLAELKEAGILTEEKFASKKAELLARM